MSTRLALALINTQGLLLRDQSIIHIYIFILLYLSMFVLQEDKLRKKLNLNYILVF